MKANIGSTDKIARIILAIIFILLYFLHIVTGVAGLIFLILAIVFLLTAFLNFCPIWHFLGISTTKKTDNETTNQ